MGDQIHLGKGSKDRLILIQRVKLRVKPVGKAAIKALRLDRERPEHQIACFQVLCRHQEFLAGNVHGLDQQRHRGQAHHVTCVCQGRRFGPCRLQLVVHRTQRDRVIAFVEMVLFDQRGDGDKAHVPGAQGDRHSLSGHGNLRLCDPFIRRQDQRVFQVVFDAVQKVGVIFQPIRGRSQRNTGIWRDSQNLARVNRTWRAGQRVEHLHPQLQLAHRRVGQAVDHLAIIARAQLFEKVACVLDAFDDLVQRGGGDVRAVCQVLGQPRIGDPAVKILKADARHRKPKFGRPAQPVD